MATLRERIGGNIKRFRKKAGMTQVDLAMALRYTSTASVPQIEKGVRGMDFDKLELAAEIFKVEAAVLLAPSAFNDQQIEDLQLFYNLYNKANLGNQMAKKISGMLHDLLRRALPSSR